MNPLLLVGAVLMSVMLTLTLVLMDMQLHGTSVGRPKEHARWVIESEYFADQQHYVDPNGATPLEPYQVWLREARQAHTRGDLKAEHRLYRNVLDLLLAEHDAFDQGVTGSQSRDKKLQEQISILLREGH